MRHRPGHRLLPGRLLPHRPRGRRQPRGLCGDDPGVPRAPASVGNDLSTPRPEWQFPGLQPGDRWCVVAVRWLQAYEDGVAAPVVLAATHERALEVIPLAVLREHAVDVPPDAATLDPA